MRSLRRLLLGAALILVAPAFAAQPPFAFATTPGALPKDVVPVEYALHIVPDIAAIREVYPSFVVAAVVASRA
jgi:aminopeptidase N